MLKNIVRLLSMNASDHCDLIEQYVHVCNQALLLNRDRFPFKQILGAARVAEKGCVVEVSIADDPLLESFVFELRGSGIVVRAHGDCPDCDCDREWSVSSTYLKCVANNPQSFIENPAKIDWEWMYGVRN